MLRFTHRVVQTSQRCPFYDLKSKYSAGSKPGFISQLVDNIKQEVSKSKEMKENLKKFREETQKLEHSAALKKARQKYESIEAETQKSSQIFKETFSNVKEKLQETIEEAQKSKLGQKAGEIGEELSKSAKGAAEALSHTGSKLTKTDAVKTIYQGVKAVKKELDETTMVKGMMYRSPQKLRMRVEDAYIKDHKIFEVNTEATGVELHKDSRFFASWENFKENNPYFNKVLDWKMKYDESHNPFIRASRLVTEKMTDIVGGLFQKTELSETLTEICKVDPSFDKEVFLRQCQEDIIPNVLEAMLRGEITFLKDWCHEGAFNILVTPIKEAKRLGYSFDSRILDIDNVDLLMGKVMDQGPVLVVGFNTQQIMCVRDQYRNIIEGDPKKVLRVNYVWVLCRDQSELNPRAAWRLMEISAKSTEQMI